MKLCPVIKYSLLYKLPIYIYIYIFSGYTADMDVLSCPIKEEETDVVDETVEKQTALNNILSSKDTTLHTEFIIKNEGEIGYTSLIDTEYKIEGFKEKEEGSSVEYETLISTEPKGKDIYFLLINIKTKCTCKGGRSIGGGNTT